MLVLEDNKGMNGLLK